YASASGTLTFAPGETSKQVGVTVSGDTPLEQAEAVLGTVVASSNPTLAVDHGTGTIQNDDSQPAISINNVGQLEGNVGSSVLTRSEERRVGKEWRATVHHATADNSATDDSDYAAKSGTRTFSPGEAC